MNTINWGIIGVGDVTELKSGPAFNKVKNSSLVAVMRRDAAKAEDYARRHNVPKWYSDAQQLINDPDVNAIYIATPPSSHEEYARAAMEAGKPVYVEKPMSVNAAAAQRMAATAQDKNLKMVVAHYRRAQPLFKKIKQLIDEKAIGDIRFVQLNLFKKTLTSEELAIPKTAWRVDASVAGGGLFHDLAPHQLDLMYHFFGDISKAAGVAANQAGVYNSDDIVSGTILFNSGVVFTGTWCFSVLPEMEKDECVITGSEGSISFSFFENDPIRINRQGNIDSLFFDKLEHVQQPMIEEVVRYFSGQGPNPCPSLEGVTIMRLIDQFTAK